MVIQFVTFSKKVEEIAKVETESASTPIHTHCCIQHHVEKLSRYYLQPDDMCLATAIILYVLCCVVLCCVVEFLRLTTVWLSAIAHERSILIIRIDRLVGVSSQDECSGT